MNTELYKTLAKDYALKRAQADELFEKEKLDIYANNPDLHKIDTEIKTLGLKASKLSIMAKSESNQKKISKLLKQIEVLKDKKENIIKNTGKTDYPKYNCEKCHDTGYITVNYVQEQCSCMKQKLIDISYNKSNLYSLENANFDNFDFDLYSNKANEEKYSTKASPRSNIKKIHELAQDFIEKFDKSDTQNLLFTGSTGTGKTFLSSCIANELIKKGYTVLYQTSPILLDKIFEYKYGDNDKASKELYDSIYNANLLIIDDLGTENLTAAKFTELFSIINTRLLNPNTKTIISSNFDLEKLSKIYDSRLISRFIGNYKICKFFGDDIRLNRK